MIKGYRKRFVIFNMTLIGVILLVAFTALGAVLYRSEYSGLQQTMELIIKPWDQPNDNFRSLDRDDIPPKKPHDGDLAESEPDDSAPKPPRDTSAPEPRGRDLDDLKSPSGRLEYDKNIIAAFYESENGELSILSENYFLDPDLLNDAVEEVVNAGDDFGTLNDYGLVYYKESVGGDYKIALAQSSYLSAQLGTIILQLCGLFVGLMALFFFISVALSKRAAKPMEDAIEMERRFVADISHDLKTPITVILANNSIIKANPETTVADQRQWIESTDDAAKNMMNMVNGMLTLSSLESKERRVEKYPVDLSPIVEKSVLQMESVAYDRGVQLDSDIAEDITVSATAEYAERICNGLLENALKYEPDGGKVLVTLSANKKKASLSIKNFGSFIESEDIGNIFDRFYRGDKTRDIKSGHGLGLPIIKQVTELIGAEISVTSTRDVGTVFTVTFDL